MKAASVVLVVRWVARVWSILSILTVLTFGLGAGLASRGLAPTAQEWLALSLFPIGVGLAIAWSHETLGGTLALASVAAFYLWNFARAGHLPRGPFFFLMAAPGLLFLIAPPCLRVARPPGIKAHAPAKPSLYWQNVETREERGLPEPRISRKKGSSVWNALAPFQGRG